MPKSPEELAHLEWLGYVQPVGLVVSIPAMLEAQCYINKNIMGQHSRFLAALASDPHGDMLPEVNDLPYFSQQVLDWQPGDLLPVPKLEALPDHLAALEVILPQYHETIRPSYVVREPAIKAVPQPAEPSAAPAPQASPKPLLLIQELGPEQDFDEPSDTDSARHWHAPPHSKFERLLRETEVPIGLLYNRRQFRLVYAPRGETSGYATFTIAEMSQVAGRPMFAAFQMLLGADRLFNLPERQRLPSILESSRKYQNVVSTALAEQVTSALFELLRGFQAADDQRQGELLRHILADNPQHIYHGLLTVLMRLVFILYAEDRGLISNDPVYSNYYSITGLFERLRSDAGRFPDTMDQRFGAWAQLLTLFRLVYHGGQHQDLKIPARKGYLFDPERFPFLEGRGKPVESGAGSVASEEWRTASGPGVERDDSELSRFGSLEKGDEPRGRVLSSDQTLPKGRTVRYDQPDTQSRSFDTSEYRGGTGQEGHQRVSEFLGDSPRFTDGGRDASDSQSESGFATTNRIGQAPIPDRPNQQNAGRSPQIAGATSKPKRLSTRHTPPAQRLTPPTTRHSPPAIPHISDGVIYRVLEDLLILDGERLSYRTLDVEQIGSVYEAIMGFDVQVAQGKSIAIKPVKSHGAPATINLDSLLAAKPTDREKLLKEWTDQKLGGGDATTLKQATTIDELVAALEKKIAKHVTPSVVPPASMVFQPSDERRRSGSHYTPRSLTEPIVRTTLEPILKQLCDPTVELPAEYTPSKADKQRYTKGELEARTRQAEKRIEQAQAARERGTPHPSQILDLKVCDPAMGSGAFLVEACRQLGDELIKSWYAHDLVPTDIPPDEDEVLYARRKVAQRCLYGVDKNIMAVDLAKLSLWLVTLAKDHPFTFLDHVLRYGDSLVGLTREQIIGFHWEPKKQMKFGEDVLQKRLVRATEARAKILSAREDVAYRDQEQRLQLANDALEIVRLLGNACVSCFFAAGKKKAREEELERVFGLASAYLSSLTTNHQQLAANLDFQSRAALQTAADRLKSGPHSIPAFHWEIEFPEVFSRENGGFDAFVGNPPFLNGMRISSRFGSDLLDWLYDAFKGAGNRADLVVYFFRNSYAQLRVGGCFGLVATNTIAQGDTRKGGLGPICAEGAVIYSATKRVVWPGDAAVIISVVHTSKGINVPNKYIDGKPVPCITSYLFSAGGEADPKQLKANRGLSFSGCYPYGKGFLFQEEAVESESIATMRSLLERDESLASVIHPYIGGEELLNDPRQQHSRYVIDLGQREEKAARARFPELMAILEEKVRPFRAKSKRKVYKEKWWLFAEPQLKLRAALTTVQRVLMHPFTSSNLVFAFVPATTLVGMPHVVIVLEDDASFGVLQSRIHESWAWFQGSSMKDDLRYTASSVFDTFPFPEKWQTTTKLIDLGSSYYSKRAKIMIDNDFGLTRTYNRFHSPDERDPGILELRRLHGEMDVAVLRAYGWDDLADHAAQPDFCQFLLDYEEDDDDAASDSSSTRQKKKPWRYRWPDDFRDEVLARLLELNEQRHKEEQLAAQSTPHPTKQPKPGKTTKKQTKKDEPTFFDD